MASSYSADLKLELMATGEKSGLWGDITNTNLTILQQAIAGYEEVSIAGGVQTTPLVFSNGLVSDGKNAVIKFIGTITGNQTVTIPDSIEKTYIISNGTTGAFTVEFKTVSGTGVTFGATDKSTKTLFADGTNIVDTGTVSLTGVQTLTNKTLTAPILDEINDSNGNEEIIFTTTASAVNEITIANAATGNSPNISVTGDDTNIGLSVSTKGTGLILFNDGAYNADATLTDGATITWDVGSSPVAKVTLGGNRTLSAPTNSASGQFISLTSNEEKNAIGIYEVEYDHSNKKDEGYFINTNEQFKFENNKVISYFGTATPKQLEDVNAVDEDGEPVLQDGVQVVIKGLKSQKISISKQQASGLLAPTDWYVVKANEVEGYTIPTAISTFRTEVRAVSNQQEAQINACTTVEQLKALYEYTNTGTEESPIYTRPIAEYPKEI
jgi:hypothetical protein